CACRAPPYASDLSGRFKDPLAYRAPLSNMVTFSVSIRALVFVATGFVLLDRLIAFALLAPFALAGLWLDNLIQGRFSRATTLRWLAMILLLVGASLVARALD